MTIQPTLLSNFRITFLIFVLGALVLVEYCQRGGAEMADSSTVSPKNSPPSASLNPLTLLIWAQSPFLVENLYPQIKGHMLAESATGAVSKVNQDWEQGGKIGNKWFIEQQRHSGDLIQLGVGMNDVTAIKDAIRATQWGLDLMRPDGSFDCPDAIHSTELFLEGAARTYMILDQSRAVPNAEELLKQWAPQFHKIAEWMIAARLKQTEKERSDTLERFNHRFFVTAAAFGMVANITHDPLLQKESETYIRLGLAKEQAGTPKYPGAIFPEREGFDCNYQAVCALMMVRCYCSCQDPDLRHKLAEAAVRAIKSVGDRIDEKGDIDLSDSTRTGKEKTRNGVLKHFGYKDYLVAVVGANIIQPSDALKTIINRIAPKFKIADVESIL